MQITAIEKQNVMMAMIDMLARTDLANPNYMVTETFKGVDISLGSKTNMMEALANWENAVKARPEPYIVSEDDARWSKMIDL